MIQPWLFIQQKLEQEIPVMLLYVLESNGSSPGRQGFKMAVSGDGGLEGSIGGGIMEHKFVEMARARLLDNRDWASLQKQVHDKSAGSNQSGMICSGDQTIFIYRLKPEDSFTIQAIVTSLNKFENGSLTLQKDSIQFSKQDPTWDYFFEKINADEFLFIEKTGFKNVLHVIGGGHCALAFCKLMSDLDFYIHVYDERSRLNTMEQNIYAHQKTVVKDYNDLSEIISEGNNVYIVVMSFGYRTDSIALKALWGKTFKYIGLLGSKKKIEKLFNEFAEEGLDKGYLDHLHSPVGLPIYSKTPAEIAISIAAEIVATKNNDQ
jgi:xanthine dehydrogenase accessory factor